MPDTILSTGHVLAHSIFTTTLGKGIIIIPILSLENEG